MTIDKIILIASSVIKNSTKVLLLQRGDDSSYPNHWQLPEGKLEEGEILAIALKREIKEEIGGEVSSLKFQTVFYTDLEAKGQQYLAIRAIFKAKLKSNEIKLSHEHKNYRWFSKKEALNLPLLPGIKEVLEKLA